MYLQLLISFIAMNSWCLICVHVAGNVSRDGQKNKGRNSSWRREKANRPKQMLNLFLLMTLSTNWWLFFLATSWKFIMGWDRQSRFQPGLWDSSSGIQTFEWVWYKLLWHCTFPCERVGSESGWGVWGGGGEGKGRLELAKVMCCINTSNCVQLHVPNLLHLS